MTRLVRLVKWALIVIGIGWAVYSANAFIFLAQTFPSPEPGKHDIRELISSVQGYAVVFGPVIVALLFLTTGVEVEIAPHLYESSSPVSASGPEADDNIKARYRSAAAVA